MAVPSNEHPAATLLQGVCSVLYPRDWPAQGGATLPAAPWGPLLPAWLQMAW
jgi:hypothetical protein